MTRFFPKSIRLQLLIIALIVGFPAIGVILYSGFRLKDDLVINASKDVQKLADRIASEHNNLVIGAEQLMIALSELPEAKNHDQARLLPILQKLKSLNPMYSNIFIADRNGLVWASAVPVKPPFIVADRRYFKNALATGKLSSGEYVLSRATTKPTFNMAYPLKDDHGSITGVISVGFIIDNYRQFLKQPNVAERTSFVLIDHRGIILSRGIETEKYIGKPYSPEYFQQILDSPDNFTTIRAGIAGDSRIISLRKLSLPAENSPYMYVTAGVPVDLVMNQANKMLLRNLAFLMAFMVLSLAFAWFFGKRSIADRISLLENAAQRFANGDLHANISDLIRGGELGRLAEAFDTMVQKLSESTRSREEKELMLREQNRQLEEEMGERQKAEERLRANERFLQTIIDTEPECVKMVDIEGNLLMMNRSGLEMIEAESFDQVKGKCVCPMLMPEYRDAFLQLTANVFAGKSGSLRFEALGLKGGHIWLETYAVPYRNEFGEISACLGISRDVTELKTVALEKSNLENQLLQSQKMESIGRLAGGVAHDFNNLLTPIMGYAELVKYKMPLDSPEIRKLDNIIQAADKARILTQQLLSFGRKQILDMKIIKMNEVIASFYEILRRTIRENIDIQLRLSHDSHCVRADSNQLLQITMNLAINSQDAIKDKGTIIIETAPITLDDEYVKQDALVKAGNYLMLVVADTGCGMDEETLSRVFEPFYTTKAIGEGTGLGLATVYGLVKQHDGYIRAFSEPGKGSVFKMYFPIIDEKPDVADVNTSEQLTSDLAGRTILLVEDNEMVRNMVNDLLISQGFTVLAEEGPKQALKSSKGEKIDLLLTDVVMPDMNGPELHKLLLKTHPGLKVIYMSGYTDNVIVHHGVLDKGINFIQKPFAVNDLADKIVTVLTSEE